MKKLIFWASALLLAGSFASCEPQGPKVANFTETVKGVSFDMIAVQGGTFQMGAMSEQGDAAWYTERPVHSVTLSSFYISRTEVTQEQYQAVMGENPSYFKGNNLPVENLRWADAQLFCQELARQTGKHYVLPTEAQWEYAARGGKHHSKTKYAGSNNEDNVIWYNTDQTHPVATKAPNALGLYDMSGNVWEWCSDWYEEYSAEAQTNPEGPDYGYWHILRGGGWDCGPIRVTCRDYLPYEESCESYGIRIALIP